MNYSNTSSAMDTDSECKYNNITVFECNICFDLAQDPVVTLCGHLFCWPCLYKWLQFHSYCHECPVCKARVDDDNLVPIYGRGTSGSDLMAHPASKDDIPSRPASRRPQTAPAPELTHFRQDRRIATLFGAISSVLNFRVVDFYDMSDYGATIGGYYYMLSSYAHGGYAHGHGFHQYASHVQGTKLVLLMICFLFLGLVVVLMTISTWLFWS